MRTMSAREAKNGFALMIGTACAEPVLIEKHGPGAVSACFDTGGMQEWEHLKVFSILLVLNA